MDIGKRIKVARLMANMSATDLVNATELTRNYVSLLENSKQNPSIKTLKLLAFALGCPVTFLVSEEPLW